MPQANKCNKVSQSDLCKLSSFFQKDSKISQFTQAVAGSVKQLQDILQIHLERTQE